MKMGVPILGTSAEDVDAAEDRELFDEILAAVQDSDDRREIQYLPQKKQKRLPTVSDIRYWFVLLMYLADRECRLQSTIMILMNLSESSTVLHRITRFWLINIWSGKEIEVDAVCDGTDILIPGIMEHIERAGIHSGDSISVYPAQSISRSDKA